MNGLKICVLLPDYSTSEIDYQHYDPPRDLSALLPNCQFTHVFLNKLTVYKQLNELKKKNFNIFVNLCEGYLDWEVPSIDVPFFLELLDLPFTGPTTLLYDPEKVTMKYVAYTRGICSPKYTLIKCGSLLAREISNLTFPLFIKPAKAGDSLGVDDRSLIHNVEELEAQVNRLLPEYPELLVEEYVAGREFTVLVTANPDDPSKTISFLPVEYLFPKGYSFKTYQLKTSELHPDANIPVTDESIAARLRSAAEKIFSGFNGKGYARLDFRMNENGELFFLEINFTCSVFYKDGYEGSADYIVKADGIGQAGFLEIIIREGMARYARTRKRYEMRGDSISGYGIYALRDINAGELIFKGEELPQRLVTLNYVKDNWNEDQLEDFRKYAYPVGGDSYLLWSDNPQDWAPQNHSCTANTHYSGLNVLASRNIKTGEELTLDYALLLDETAAPFKCNCQSDQCRGVVRGQKLQYDQPISSINNK
ncbi:MAG: SET domain-containing protein-lysine N-methyltransferase [Chitinophagaceae bacterium]|nr:SET domain-containing protein-lysine N-methyltransferase [Bacteroidota bacterium]MCC6256985.1 SET domain-containing protein-lysine N-methyltransferase [Chitinophagaceae bacterium]MCW5916346.1 SET domain-containing protein-lysine N-methyltransferase [Ferruginibacter sp.]